MITGTALAVAVCFYSLPVGTALPSLFFLRLLFFFFDDDEPPVSLPLPCGTLAAGVAALAAGVAALAALALPWDGVAAAAAGFGVAACIGTYNTTQCV
jgi:hypothetical protein